ncbi:MAG: hypothetical protein H7338_00130 [Candidatus Sericytochromatia bacterium]|nr:hypothetical protein [Candidatus Sericytochromatia bacterium]
MGHKKAAAAKGKAAYQAVADRGVPKAAAQVGSALLASLQEVKAVKVALAAASVVVADASNDGVPEVAAHQPALAPNSAAIRTLKIGFNKDSRAVRAIDRINLSGATRLENPTATLRTLSAFKDRFSPEALKSTLGALAGDDIGARGHEYELEFAQAAHDGGEPIQHMGLAFQGSDIDLVTAAACYQVKSGDLSHKKDSLKAIEQLGLTADYRDGLTAKDPKDKRDVVLVVPKGTKFHAVLKAFLARNPDIHVEKF